jgi:hypothetical protein
VSHVLWTIASRVSLLAILISYKLIDAAKCPLLKRTSAKKAKLVL